MSVWTHQEWEQTELQMHANLDDVQLHMKALRRLVAEEKYRALVEEQGTRTAKTNFWSIFRP